MILEEKYLRKCHKIKNLVVTCRQLTKNWQVHKELVDIVSEKMRQGEARGSIH